MVDDAARGTDNDVDAAFEGDEVGLNPPATNKAEGAEAVEASEVFDDIADLLGKLTRGDQDDRLDRVSGWVDGACERETEGNGLSGASLGEPDDVFAIEEKGEGCCLDGGGDVVAKSGDGVEADVICAECGELLRVSGGCFWQSRRGSFRCGDRGVNRLGFGGALAVAASTAAATTCRRRRIVRYRGVMVVRFAGCAMGGGGGFDRSGCYGDG